MKRFSLFMVVIMMLVTSCSNDDSLEKNISQGKNFSFKSETDSSGVAVSVFNEVIEEYVLNYQKSVTTQDEVINAIEAIMKSNLNFKSLDGCNEVITQKGQIENCIEYPMTVVRSLPYSGAFLNSIDTFFNQEVNIDDNIAVIVADYMAKVNNDVTLNDEEKRLLIMYSSLANEINKQKNKFGKGDDDEGWDMTRSVMATGLEGSLYSTAQGVINMTVLTALSL
ncbi:hypothetical protein [Flavobacterium sp.]|uniref:hypothetical protein n=1 Tax=Flavobacterium sp. TaxID=239 RepID=UPI003A8E9F80